MRVTHVLQLRVTHSDPSLKGKFLFSSWSVAWVQATCGWFFWSCGSDLEAGDRWNRTQPVERGSDATPAEVCRLVLIARACALNFGIAV